MEFARPREDSCETIQYSEVHFRVRLRYPNDIEGLFDGTTASALNGQSHYNFPSTIGLFEARSLRKYRQNLIASVNAGLSWFERYSNPAQCLELLKSGETSIGPIKISGASREAFDFLTSLR